MKWLENGHPQNLHFLSNEKMVHMDTVMKDLWDKYMTIDGEGLEPELKGFKLVTLIILPQEENVKLRN